jgi:hypothetical protein
MMVATNMELDRTPPALGVDFFDRRDPAKAHVG